MAKPLHELDLAEVLERLTPTQKDSVLAYARQFARSNLAASQHGNNRPTASDPSETKPVNTVGEASATKTAKGTPSEPAPKSNSWFIDGRVRKPTTPTTPVAQKPKLVKCGRCGVRLIESEFNQHWKTAHPKKTGKPIKCGACGRMIDESTIEEHWRRKHSSGRKPPEKAGKQNARKKAKPVPTRLVQGGLCSPR